ncbi:hypothetical protein [Arthrobacter sp. NPDC090010]|uniref:hypothetical protein n=1 Tax=Arthrobacter sp. NPDC090010 TaxID=3363942 RepID=UPI0038272C01
MLVSEIVLEWRTEGLVPTYTDGEMYGWMIDDRISLETDIGSPITAWAEFVYPRSGRPGLATYRGHVPDGPGFQVWGLWAVDGDGRSEARPRSPELVHRVIPAQTWPSHPDREGVSPVLRRLWDEAVAGDHAPDEPSRRGGESDALSGEFSALAGAGIDYGISAEMENDADMDRAAERIRAAISTIRSEDLPEVLFRMTLEYGNVSVVADAGWGSGRRPGW